MDSIMQNSITVEDIVRILGMLMSLMIFAPVSFSVTWAWIESALTKREERKQLKGKTSGNAGIK